MLRSTTAVTGLVQKESKSAGNIGRKVYVRYAANMGNGPVACLLALLVVGQALLCVSDW